MSFFTTSFLILRTLIWGTRGVIGKGHCAISVVSHSCANDAQEWGTPALAVQAGKASATRRELASTHGTELGWTGGDARLSTSKKSPALRNFERGF